MPATGKTRSDEPKRHAVYGTPAAHCMLIYVIGMPYDNVHVPVGDVPSASHIYYINFKVI